MLRAAKVKKEFIDACRYHRCSICEETAPKKPTHKTTLPSQFIFNHTLGIDVLELTDSEGAKFQVLNMVCMGTSFQLLERVREGAGQPTSNSCLKALLKRWISWCGPPKNIVCDRGLHNRGILQQYMNEHGIPVIHAALEAPETIGKVERHGGIAKALFRKVCRDNRARGREQVEMTLLICQVKNSMTRTGGSHKHGGIPT